jgi:sugar lactone lactonase YvrE
MSNPPVVDVITGLFSPAALKFNGDDLYVVEQSSPRVFKFDTSNSGAMPINEVLGINSTFGIDIRGNELYITDFGDGKILTKEVSSSSTQTNEVVAGLVTPAGMLIVNDVIYFAESLNNRILSFPLQTLSIDNNNLQEFIIYPNPATNIISIKNLETNTPFVIYNIRGQKVLNGNLSTENQINVSGLKTGVYILNSGTSNFRFIKN